MNSHYPIHLKVETTSGSQLFFAFKHYPHIPERNDIIFWEGENYKVVYRKFIYLVGNQELTRVYIKVEKIGKNF